MKEDVFRPLKERVEKIEEKYGSLENFVKTSTNLDDKHRMRMEEDYSSIFQELEVVYQEFADMELADLLDYQKFVGRFNGEND